MALRWNHKCDEILIERRSTCLKLIQKAECIMLSVEIRYFKTQRLKKDRMEVEKS